jgi:hypothetical protein
LAVVDRSTVAEAGPEGVDRPTVSTSPAQDTAGEPETVLQASRSQQVVAAAAVCGGFGGGGNMRGGFFRPVPRCGFWAAGFGLRKHPRHSRRLMVTLKVPVAVLPEASVAVQVTFWGGGGGAGGGSLRVACMWRGSGALGSRAI